MQIKKIGSQKSDLLILWLCFVCLQMAWMLTTTWPVGGGDSDGYLHRAQMLAEGKSLFTNQVGRVTFTTHALMAGLMVLGLSMRWFVIIQTFVNGLAVLAMYDLCRKLNGRLAGIFAATYFMINMEIFRWNRFLLTESLAINLIVLSVWALDLTWRTPNSKNTAFSILTLTITALTRPQWRLAPMFAGLSFVPEWKRKSSFWPILVFAMVITLFFVKSTNSYTNQMNPAQYLYKGQVIWGHDASRVAMPAPKNPGDISLSATISYIKNHPVDVITLLFQRIYTELRHTRTFYSRSHNALILAYYLPLYTCFLVGLCCKKTWQIPSMRFCILMIFSQIAIVALMHADWDGRWLTQITGLLIIVASNIFAFSSSNQSISSNGENLVL